MKKKKNWLPFEQAREFIRDQQIGSRTQYLKWFEQNHPQQIPKYPHRVYREEFTTWNDWLGNDNKFKISNITYRPFEEALIYTHKLGLPSQQAWFKHIKENPLPEDIPAHPELVYKTWLSWSHWLGNKTVQKVQAAQVVEEVDPTLFVVINDPNDPPNIITFKKVPGGKSELQDRMRKTPFNIIRVFKFEQELMDSVWEIINNHTSSYYEDESRRLCSNVNQLMWDLSNLLIIVR